MSNRLRTAFAAQSASCAALGSPFMAQLMGLCADRLAPGCAITDRLLAWPGDVSPSAQSLPLRLAGGLHALVLRGHPLAKVYPPNAPTDAPSDDALWDAVNAALHSQTDALTPWLNSAPQTNEVRRSCALILTGSLLAQRFGLPLVLSELGASAGLNLMFDQYGMGDFGIASSAVQLTPDITGPLPTPHPFQIRARAGVDLNPLDPADQTRLLSYLWPDQPHRLALTRAALTLTPAKPEQGDAAPWLASRLATQHPGATHLVFHTIAFQYFPKATQTACHQALQTAGAAATMDAPLAHLSYEADDQNPGAALTLTTWPGGTPQPLGRVDFHGRWLHLA